MSKSWPPIKGLQPISEFNRMVAENQGKQSRGNKFGAVRTDGFDSKKEAGWAQQLATLRDGGYIRNVKVDKRDLMYALDVNGTRVCQYEADAAFEIVKDFTMETLDGPVLLKAGERHVLDAKSAPTRRLAAFHIKRNLMWALYKIKLLEV